MGSAALPEFSNAIGYLRSIQMRMIRNRSKSSSVYFQRNLIMRVDLRGNLHNIYQMLNFDAQLRFGHLLNTLKIEMRLKVL